MTYLIVLLTCMILALAALSIALFRLRRREYTDHTEVIATAADVSVGGIYRPVERLFDDRDFDLVKRSGPAKAALRRFRGQRRRILRLYMGELRRDFLRLWRLGRYLAPLSQNPDFAALVSRQFLTFHLLYISIHIRYLLLGSAATSDLRGVVSAFESLRTAARRTLDAMGVPDAETRLGDMPLGVGRS